MSRIRALAFRRDAMKWVMQNDPVIAAKISDNLLIRLQSFAAISGGSIIFCAHIEGAAPLVYGIHAPPEPQAAALAQLAPSRANAQPAAAPAQTTGDIPDISTSATLPIPPESHDTLSI